MLALFGAGHWSTSEACRIPHPTWGRHKLTISRVVSFEVRCRNHRRRSHSRSLRRQHRAAVPVRQQRPGKLARRHQTRPFLGGRPGRRGERSRFLVRDMIHACAAGGLIQCWPIKGTQGIPCSIRRSTVRTERLIALPKVALSTRSPKTAWRIAKISGSSAGSIGGPPLRPMSGFDASGCVSMSSPWRKVTYN